MNVINLNNYQFVRASGPDSKQFLQGQLSCNMESLKINSSLTGALCNIKGRVVSDFQVALIDDDCLLRTTSKIADVIIQTLAKYAVFSKVELSNDKSVLQVFGLIGPESINYLKEKFGVLPEYPGNCVNNELGTLIRSPGTVARFEFWCKDEAMITEIANQTVSGHASNQWQHEDVRAGIVHIDTTRSEDYTPQLLNYDISGVIDFNKGCYTGQEVIARMFYRGKPKKRLYLLASDNPLNSESKLLQLNADDIKPAEILSIGNSAEDSGEPSLVLAILDTEAVEGDWKFALSDHSESFLQIQSLPYSV